MASRAVFKSFRGEHVLTESSPRKAVSQREWRSWRELRGLELTRYCPSLARQISINHKQIINIFQSRRAEKKYLAPSDS